LTSIPNSQLFRPPRLPQQRLIHPKRKKPEKQRECTQSKKQGHKYYIGHVYTDCRKFKALRANPTQQSKRDETDKEQEKIATVSNMNSDWLTSFEYPTEKAFISKTSLACSAPE
jgi:hypothetical protein